MTPQQQQNIEATIQSINDCMFPSDLNRQQVLQLFTLLIGQLAAVNCNSNPVYALKQQGGIIMLIELCKNPLSIES